MEMNLSHQSLLWEITLWQEKNKNLNLPKTQQSQSEGVQLSSFKFELAGKIDPQVYGIAAGK